MNEGINNRQKKKISLMEIFIPLFCLINGMKLHSFRINLRNGCCSYLFYKI